ncbi:hypothetical protein NQZ68_017979 [Dissostichus eleginoides]|nr:hypothetical protein NQZ68_017979 [Dissostichus eleginoides]
MAASGERERKKRMRFRRAAWVVGKLQKLGWFGRAKLLNAKNSKISRLVNREREVKSRITQTAAGRRSEASARGSNTQEEEEEDDEGVRRNERVEEEERKESKQHEVQSVEEIAGEEMLDVITSSSTAKSLIQCPAESPRLQIKLHVVLQLKPQLINPLQQEGAAVVRTMVT